MIDVVGRRMGMRGKSWGFGWVRIERGERGLVRAGRDSAPAPGSGWVGLPKPTRAASGDVPTKTNRQILSLGRHKNSNNNAAIPSLSPPFCHSVSKFQSLGVTSTV